MNSKRRICWPPDATCLEGGCIYCPDASLVTEKRIRDFAETAGQLPNRGNEKTTDAWAAYLYGVRS